MARDFNGTAVTGTGEFLEVDATPITGPGASGMAVSGWGYPGNTNAFKDIISIIDKDDPNQWLVRLAFDNAGHISCYSRDGATNDGGVATSTSYTANTWHHASCNVRTGGRDVYLNGGGKATNSVAKAPTGVDRVAIGAARDSTPSDPFLGRLAEVAVWNAELTDGEHALLARGISPLRIRPGNLILYYPLFGTMSPEPNLAVGGATYNLTITGTPDQADHAPVMPPFAFMSGWAGAFTAAAAAGSPSLPPMRLRLTRGSKRHLRKRRAA